MLGHQNWQDKLVDYIQGYRSVFPLTPVEVQTFSWFMRFKALNMYLWTKNNWKSDVAPGGASTKEWLTLLKDMIMNQTWMESLNRVVGNIE